MAAKKDSHRRVVAENRKARFNYAIEETFEAGIELLGTEVKSLRAGRASLGEAYAAAEHGDIFLINAFIPEYSHASQFFQHEPRRPRRLLLHRRQIARLTGAVQREGMTLIPLRLYFNDRGRVKLELALARGKKLHDKRETERERTWQRDRARLLRQRG